MTTTGTVTATRTGTAIATVTATGTTTASKTAVATSTSTSTPSGIINLSTNTTTVYVNHPITEGLLAAIGLSGVFAIMVFLGCCGIIYVIVRRRVDAKRRDSVVILKDRRESKATQETGMTLRSIV
jgi:hypothetical protein